MDDLRASVRRALDEDLGTGDVTTEATVPAEARARAVIVQKAPGVIFGLDAAELAFRELDPEARAERRVGEGGGARRARSWPSRVSARAAERGAHGAELPGTALRRRDPDRPLRARDRGHGRPHPRHAQDHPRPARPREGGRGGGRRQSTTAPGSTTRSSSRRTTSRWPAGWGRRCAARGSTRPACPSRSSAARSPRSTRRWPRAHPDPSRQHVTRGAAHSRRARRRARRARGERGITPETLRAHAATGVEFVSLGALTHSAPALDLSLVLTPLR